MVKLQEIIFFRIATRLDETVNIMDIDNHQLCSIPLISVEGVSQAQIGLVILILVQYEYYGKSKSINSPVQFEAFQNKADDKSIKLGGNQIIKTYYVYVFPLDSTDGFSYLRLRPFAASEWDKLPHICMTSDTD